MYKLLYTIAAAALVIAFIDLQGPPGSSAATEGAYLLLLAALSGGLGFWHSRISSRLCPHCAERVKVDARKCKHCGSDLPG